MNTFTKWTDSEEKNLKSYTLCKSQVNTALIVSVCNSIKLKNIYK